MREIEIDTINEILDAAFKNTKAISPIFVGDTGIGKTQMIERYCKDNHIYLKTLILSQLEASETLGIPIKHQIKYDNGSGLYGSYDVLRTAIPEWVFDLKDKSKGTFDGYENGAMLFLDEFLCAQPSVMNSFLNFLTQKKVGDIDLKDVRIVAATNIGMYTFEPDTNILSRFCWFYVVNNKINDYLNDKRIISNYKDENPRDGILFEPRNLKPRCHEWLTYIDDEYLQCFYEGFTNQIYIKVHKDDAINSSIGMYFEFDSKSNSFVISHSNISNMCAVLKAKFPRIKNWAAIFDGFVNINDVKALDDIKKCLIS